MADVLKEIIQALMAIPDAVWAALIASLITLWGVRLTDREATRRLRVQLQHDSDERERDRQMTLRKDVYVRGAEAITRIHGLLGQLASLDIPDREFSTEYQAASAEIAKIQIVGTNSTVQAVLAFLNALVAAYAELTMERLRLVVRKNEMEALTKDIDKSLNQQESHDRLLGTLILEGNSNERQSVIRNILTAEQARSEGLIKRRQELAKVQGRESVEFLKLIGKRASELAILIPPAVFAVREELEMPLDRAEYLKHVQESTQKTMKVLDAAIRRMEDALAP